MHKMRNTAREILSGEVITIPIMENSHTNQEEIILAYQNWDILAIKAFHNTTTFVAYAQIKAIMTINAIMLNKS